MFIYSRFCYHTSAKLEGDQIPPSPSNELTSYFTKDHITLFLVYSIAHVSCVFFQQFCMYNNKGINNNNNNNNKSYNNNNINNDNSGNYIIVSMIIIQ